MFCRKCGNQISDDSLFCSKCGTKIEIIEKKEIIADSQKINESVEEKKLTEDTVESVLLTTTKKSSHRVLAGIVVLLLIVMIAVLVSENSKKCDFGGCDNYKMSGSNYCRDHACSAEGCKSSKSKYDSYCVTHEADYACGYSGCESYKVEGSDYCYSHTCSKVGCNNKVSYDSDYCTSHQVDMRKKLTDSSFSFSLNSVGGIEFDFRATNSTGKEIKYVRFQVELRNAVGDLVKEEIRNASSVDVEIIGPVRSGKNVYMVNEIIGYCDNCARIDIDDMTIVYTDGTSETGHYGYYYEK